MVRLSIERSGTSGYRGGVDSGVASRGRRKGIGRRGGEALAIIQEQPGVTIPELAARLDIKQNYISTGCFPR